jgi:ribonucleoside-diphosphate reductase, beta subunit
LKRKLIYNPASQETLNDRRVFNGNPHGILNFTKAKYQWALKLWDLMEANTWFPKEVDTSSDVKDYSHSLTEAEKRMYDLVWSQLISMDSFQTNNLADNINPYITAPEINACLARQAYEEANHCFTEGHQILTSIGFIDFRDLTQDHLVANWWEGGDITFEKPLEIIQSHYSGDVYHFEGRSHDFTVTPNHRIVTYDVRQNNKLSIPFAEKVGLNNRTIPVNGTKQNGTLKHLSFYDRIRIAFQADGCFSNHQETATENGYSARFSFKKERKIMRMESLLKSASKKELNKYTKTKDSYGYTRFYVWINTPFSKNFDWVDFSEITETWCDEFIEELKEWDGSGTLGTEAVRFGTVSERVVEQIITISTLGGYIVGVERIDPKTAPKTRVGKNKQIYHFLYIRKAHYRSGRVITKTKEHYTGNIYCCTVSSGMIIVKNGYGVTVSGNSKSYAVMVEAVSDNTDLIYEMEKHDDMLRKKNAYISSVYEELAGEVTDEKLLLAMVANQILEGIYFYSGFTAIYALARTGKMLGSANMIRFIQRDEITHLLLFQNMINSVRKERPDLFTKQVEDKIYDMFEKAGELEIKWGKYITQNQIMGLTDDIIEQYIQYLVDQRLVAIGLKRIYNVAHPIKWVDDFAKFNDQKSNFFEAKVTNYSKGSISFDDF